MFTYKNIKNYSFLMIGLLLIIASIIPKGAWSYFNDVEEIPNTLAVGTCSFEAITTPFDLKNMFPNRDGQTKTMNITLKNNGSFFIDKLSLEAILDKKNYNGNGVASAENFAEQFDLNFYANGELLNEQTLTLAQIVAPNKPLNIAAWFPEQGLNGGQQLNLTVEFSFVLKHNKYKNKFEGKSLPVEFRVVGICGSGDDGGDPSNPGEPGKWDKSSLSFNGPSGISNTQIFATVKNGSGSRDMQGPVRYEVYWIASGNPKGGTVVASGEIPALDSGESYKLTYTPTKAGIYKFKAYQRPGHPGKGELWSWSIEVK
ncbi:SipW-cognate class signal peptide [Schinkia azotoformans MEV2011]|uniref:SipW-cognate class signal peptide n=1 Tax=Schinkia azotoformans MEV2011 TaxID=1348973 RepID=A0A072NJU7_SCHAZ|nr:TasA family protein [Schinkia azotoformans]KEF37741.1 SipW-cognate class signal peptide [Schinkia azotoformans MEV2011]MEC1695639.1 TasA family protein [Schinkia azotoformans]MEC1717190.1 TasA family protein [Schinkia azotoformans]MEC1726542.1 TasA family protein [Schinkia azotoformans]MEC1742004.1 TasA family protein [Schinkia azotoformans]